ncbi:MAG: NHL repeat-containing protein [Lachnospiraceae bacterium]|nr:NHL repeat-containing protein [Lachnospiraceae bacterium]
MGRKKERFYTKKHQRGSSAVRIRKAALLTAAILFLDASEVRADMPYDTYSYNYWGEEVKEPHSYLYAGMISGDEIGTDLSYPSDLFVDDQRLYVADTGNSRVLVLSMDGALETEIGFAKNEADPLKNPQGVFVTEEGHIYVADTGNSRIVEYDSAGNYLREIGRPVTTLIPDTQEYSPTRVVVDGAGRIYVIAYGINMGLVEFNGEGEFQGFMGATQVSVSMFTYIWKNYFSTQAQQDRMETIIPTEYSNIFVDNENFIYATINNLSSEDREAGADAIRRLNPTGTDILRRLGQYPIIGDLEGATFGYDYSSFVDVAATDYGCYFILDETDGKIFAYDYDGISLFVFGRNGIRAGNFQKPVSIGLSGDESRIYVLDNTLNRIFVFQITDYGRHLLDAIRLNNMGDAEGSTREWQEVLKLNSNSELAYTGLGKTYLTEGNYKEAMECFELGNSKKYYSKAFSYYRKEVMETYLTKAVIAAAVLFLVIWLIRRIRRYRRWVCEVRCYMQKN